MTNPWKRRRSAAGGASMITFSEAYTSLGPDVEAIAELLGITAAEADKKINAEMDRRYEERREKRLAYQREYNLRIRAQLRQIRAGASV